MDRNSKNINVDLECLPRLKYFTDRIKDMPDRMYRIIDYRLKQHPCKKKDEYSSTLDFFLRQKMKQLPEKYMSVIVTGDINDIINYQDLIKKTVPVKGNNTEETRTWLTGHIFTALLKEQIQPKEFIKEIAKAHDSCRHPMFIIQTTHVKSVSKLLNDMVDKLPKDSQFIIVKAQRPQSASPEPPTKIHVTGNSPHRVTRSVETSELKHKRHASSHDNWTSGTGEEMSTEAEDKSPVGSPPSSPPKQGEFRQRSKSGTVIKGRRLRKLSHSDSDDINVKKEHDGSIGDKRPITRSMVKQELSKTVAGDQRHRANISSADADCVKIVITSNDTGKHWSPDNVIADAVTDQIENDLYDLLEEILKFAEAVRKDTREEDNEAEMVDTKLDRFIFEVECLMKLSKTRRGLRKLEEYKQREDDFLKVRKGLSFFNQVEASVTMFGTLHVHIKSEKPDGTVPLDQGDYVRSEVNNYLLKNGYTKGFKIHTINWPKLV